MAGLIALGILALYGYGAYRAGVKRAEKLEKNIDEPTYVGAKDKVQPAA